MNSDNFDHDWFEKRDEYKHDADWFLDYIQDVNDTPLAQWFVEAEEHTEEWERGEWSFPQIEYYPLAGHPIFGRIPYLKDWSINITTHMKMSVLFGTMWERKYPRDENDPHTFGEND